MLSCEYWKQFQKNVKHLRETAFKVKTIKKWYKTGGCRGKFRTESKDYDEDFCENCLQAFVVKRFPIKFHHKCLIRSYPPL